MSRARARGELSFDWILLLLVIALAGVGLLNQRSAAEVGGHSYHLTQMIRLAVTGGLAMAIGMLDYRVVERWAYVLLGGVFVLLLAVPVVGTSFNNSTRWLNLGVFLLQPSELLKLTVILVTARYFHDHAEQSPHSFGTLWKPALMCVVPSLLVAMQPDLGTAITVFLIFGSIAVFEGVRRRIWLTGAVAAMTGGPLMWFFGMHQYQRDRVIAFLNPTKNLQGDAWQVNQSKIAIGSGQMWGKGWLQGTQVQNGFVPEHENDFIFAHHGEQFGFMGSVALLALYLALILWALRIARHGRDRFAVLSAVGIAAFFFWHVIINIGMVTGMLPVVGLWLPFASYGGSSMLTVMSSIGLLMSVSRHRQARS